MKCFQNKVAVVTGAGSGIGRNLCIQMAQAGARLAMSDVNDAGLAETVKRLPPGTDYKCYRVDVASREQVYGYAESVKRDFGTAHYVFNNAGVTVAGTIMQNTIEEIDWQMGINVWGVIYGTKAFLPMLLEQKEGHIINLSSMFGIVSCAGQGAYNLTKFAVRGWTECLWQELEGTGVYATSVHPGGIKTEFLHSAKLSDNLTRREKRALKASDKMLKTPPEDMARAILQGVAHRKKRVIYGNMARTLYLLQRFFPVSYGKVFTRMMG
jgi:NAD(P)-dependent dehydrogenase (short-subunit alcohol dehydrogenase family)